MQRATESPADSGIAALDHSHPGNHHALTSCQPARGRWAPPKHETGVLGEGLFSLSVHGYIMVPCSWRARLSMRIRLGAERRRED